MQQTVFAIRRVAARPPTAVGHRRQLLALLLCLGLPWPAPATADTTTPESLQADASLSEMVRYAYHHHPRLQASQALVGAAASRGQREAALPDPMLELNQGLRESGNQSLALTQSIPLWGKRGLTRQRADDEVEAARATLHANQLAVERELRRAWIDYAWSQAAEALVGEQLSLLTQLTEQTRRRYETGRSDLPALLRLQNEQARLANEQQALRSQQRAAHSRLASALAIDSTALGHPVTTLPAPPVPPDDAAPLLASLTEHNPQLRALRHQIDARARGQQLAERAGRPDLKLGLEYMRQDMMPRDELALMVGIQLPLQRGRYRAQRAEADALHRASHWQLQEQEQRLAADLEIALFNLQQAARTVRLYQDSLLPRAEQAMAVTVTAWQAGQASFADLIASQREHLTLALSHQRALADALGYQTDIDALTGRSLLTHHGETP